MRDAFLDLFVIPSFKDAWVVDIWEDGSWNPRFFRQLNDWELEEADNFFGRLHDHSLSLDSENILVWRDTKNDVFSVKSFYSSLANRGAEPFPHGIVWNSWTSIRVSFFA